jgi:hypothetical protein
MGNEHGIERFEVNAQHLLPKVGATIDEDALAMHLHEAGATQAFVFRVLGCTHFAGAPYLGHSARGSATKYRDFHIITK